MPDPSTGNPYRTARAARAQASWRDWRSILVAFVVLAGVLLASLSSQTRLSCDRGTGWCRVVKTTVVSSKETAIPMADITGASLRVVTGARHLRSYEIQIATTSGPVPLTAAGTDEEMQAFVASANDFFRAPTRPQFEAGYGSIWRRLKGMCGVFALLLLAVAYSRPAVRVTADRTAQRLVFDIRPFGPLFARRRTYPLGSVQRASVSSRRFVHRKSSWVELAMTDGTSVEVAGAHATDTRCQLIAGRINGVLGLAGG